MDDSLPHVPNRHVIQVAYVSDQNSVAVLGRPFRWVRDTARSLGVPVFRGKLVPLADFDDALRKDSERRKSLPGDASGVDAVLAAIGRVDATK